MFDIIIPCYNSNSNYLKAAIDSVLNQTYQDFHIYICDGTDSNHENVKKSLSEYDDSRITIIPQIGFGVSRARNQALDSGSNPYIALLDSDDLWNKGKLQFVKQYIEKNEVKMLWGASKVIYEGRDDWPEFRTGYLENWNETALEHKWFRIGWCPIMTSTVIFKRETLIELGGWKCDMFMGEDTELNVRFLKNYPEDCHQINAYMGTYRKHNNQTSKSNERYNKNIRMGLRPNLRVIKFKDSFKQLQELSDNKYSETYWNTLNKDIENYRYKGDTETNGEWNNYILRRTDGLENGSLFTEQIYNLSELIYET